MQQGALHEQKGALTMDSWHIALARELITCTIHGNLLKVLHWLPWGHYERKNCLPLQALW
ncbi:hypothetical protein KM92DES2_20481 [uncultured Desulfovibrio sp.]|uniref:Uncharacterized protein n=1 Tax=uncultured Desulfovibrio sp. TaxID=167968 RepID=A0A212KL77_9BACT|nr:hypothetical protein KM92DES2_20481 [uncultured Desulfovibrio sp.]